jgi:hypothetical protein
VLPADRSFTPTHATLVRRKPIAATASIQPQQARTLRQNPHSARGAAPAYSRDFAPWRFLDVGYNSARIVSASRRPKTCTTPDMPMSAQKEKSHLTAASQFNPDDLGSRSHQCGDCTSMDCAYGYPSCEREVLSGCTNRSMSPQPMYGNAGRTRLVRPRRNRSWRRAACRRQQQKPRFGNDAAFRQAAGKGHHIHRLRSRYGSK